MKNNLKEQTDILNKMLAVRMTTDDHSCLKIYCAKRNITMSDFIHIIIKEKFEQEVKNKGD